MAGNIVPRVMKYLEAETYKVGVIELQNIS